MMTTRAARLLAWSLVVLYTLLATTGLVLQVLADEPWFPVLGFTRLGVLSVALGNWGVMGALIVSQQPKNPIGWILCAVPVAAASDPFAFGYAAYNMRAYAGPLPGADLAVVWTAISGGGVLIVLLLILLCLLFPDGQPLSGRWLWPAWTGIGAAAVAAPLLALRPGTLQYYPIFINPIGIAGSAWAVLDPLLSLALAVALLSVLAAAFSLIIRLRQAQGDERQQVKWLAYTAAFWPAGLMLNAIAPNSSVQGAAWALQSVTIVGLPIATAIAMFKYRLYDIDVIVNRTLVYGGLTGTLAAVYFFSVAVLQRLLPAESQLAIVVSTLAIAALFNPLRRRIQNDIDRLFYRRKYDAEQVLMDFARSARDETNLDRLTGELMAVVEKTLQPAHESIWFPADKTSGSDR